MVVLGIHFGRQQQSTDEYFTGGGRMNPALIGVSMFATLFSTISYLSTPGEIIKHGPIVSLMSVLGVPLYYMIVGYVLVPAYMQYRTTSAYELLEERLGVGVRITGALMFVGLRLMWMSTLIYFASEAIIVMLGIERVWLPLVTLVTGVIAVSYSSLGGLRAVVITDSIQFTLLFGGALIVIGLVTWDVGGLSWIPTSWNPSWDDQPLFSLNPYVRATAFGSILQGVLWWVCTAGGDQTAIQRFMATGSVAAARRSFLINSIAGTAVGVVLTLVGFALLTYFQSDPSRMAGMTIAEDADGLFPFFISNALPVGLSGLVMCGLFAAAMSSIDSGVNAITAVLNSDFVDRFRSEPLPDHLKVKFARWMALAIGLVVVFLASFVLDVVPGNYIGQAKRTFGLLVTPMFLLFFFALFVPFATQAGTIIGSLAAFVAAFVIAYWNKLTELPIISFQWIFPVSLLVGLSVGGSLSFLETIFRNRNR
ncbi:MAG: sodium-coupled permease [Planctomycetaceae bacterium]|nr:sodium-coupled permease [Planctomycetaceae bacterium]